MAEAPALYIFSQMKFETPEHIKQHLVETITSAFIAEVQDSFKAPALRSVPVVTESATCQNIRYAQNAAVR